MTMHRSPVFWLGIAVALVIWGQFESGYKGRLELWESGIANCRTVTQPAALDAAEREHDILASEADQELFSDTAREARERQGGFEDTANTYQGIADRSAIRVTRSQARADRATERAKVPCSKRWPKPKREIPLLG